MRVTVGTIDPADAERYQSRRDVRRVPHTATVGLVAFAIAVAASAVSLATGYATGYPDAESHLTVARRLWDGPDAGFGQLGTVWLPLPHLLLAPLTWLASFNEELWRIGLPGAVLSSVALGLTTAAIYRVMARMGITSWPVIILGLSVIVLNPTMLYLSTTALTEPLLIAGIAMTAAGLSGFIASARPLSGGEVAVYIGGPAALAVGSRYDGWIFAALTAAALLVISWRRWGSWRFGVRTAIAFALPATIIALWWVLLNWVAYDDPLAFQRGPYSAASLQQEFAALGLLPTEGSWVVSAETYGSTVWTTLGGLTAVGALLGFGVLAFNRTVGEQSVVVWLLTFPFVYHVVSLYTGQSVIWNEMTQPAGLFNTRYAAPLLLACALAVSVAAWAWHESGFAQQHRRAVEGATVLLIAAMVITGPGAALVNPGHVPALAEAQRNLAGDVDLTAATDFVRKSAADDEVVLVDESVNVALVRLGMSFDNVRGRFSDDFDAQLRDPNADWVIARDSPNDLVWQALTGNGRFARRYVQVFDAGDIVVLRRQGATA